MDIQIPPGFEADIRKVQQLKSQRRRDPLATADLIQLYERIAERLQVNENPLFYAALQNNLGEAYCELPTGDRASNLAQAIGCFQEALRFWTPEAAPLEYAKTRYTAVIISLAGILIGKAIQEVRASIKPTGDPTWLASTVVSDPLVTILRGRFLPEMIERELAEIPVSEYEEDKKAR